MLTFKNRMTPANEAGFSAQLAEALLFAGVKTLGIVQCLTKSELCSRPNITHQLADETEWSLDYLHQARLRKKNETLGSRAIEVYGSIEDAPTLLLECAGVITPLMHRKLNKRGLDLLGNFPQKTTLVKLGQFSTNQELKMLLDFLSSHNLCPQES